MSEITIRPVDGATASEAEIAAIHDFTTRIMAEMAPDDPPRSFEEVLRSFRIVVPFVDVLRWVAERSGELVAYAILSIGRMEENRHLAQFDIRVLPEFRRRGFGGQLLKRIAETSGRENRRLLITQTVSTAPSGEEFLKRIGASVGLQHHLNQLVLADVSRDLISAWLAGAPENDFEIGCWIGPYPESDIAAIAEILKVMNTAPRGDLEVEDIHWTVEQLRQSDAAMMEQKIERWFMYAREKRTSQLAGYSSVAWNPAAPEIIMQIDTGVLPRYRNRGLGRWLKAAVIEKVLREKSQAKHIRTGNADTNAAMLKINHELGFKHHRTMKIWQVGIDKVAEYLAHPRKG